MSTQRVAKSSAVQSKAILLDHEPLTVEQYGVRAAKTDRFAIEEADFHYRELSFGLYGEVGGLLSALKKGKRDQLTQPESKAVKEELGDALWYLVNLAKLCGVDAESLGRSGLAFLRESFGESAKTHPSKITFRVLDGITSYQHSALARACTIRLRELAEVCGQVVAKPLNYVLKLDAKTRAC